MGSSPLDLCLAHSPAVLGLAVSRSTVRSLCFHLGITGENTLHRDRGPGSALHTRALRFKVSGLFPACVSPGGIACSMMCVSLDRALQTPDRACRRRVANPAASCLLSVRYWAQHPGGRELCQPQLGPQLGVHTHPLPVRWGG